MNESADEKYGQLSDALRQTRVRRPHRLRRPPRNHLPSGPVVAEEFNNAFHAQLTSTDVFPVIVSACGQVQWRFQLASAVTLFELA